MILVPDTNVLIHYKSFLDIDWPKIASVKQVCLIFVMPVIDELDKHKFNPRLSDRAERVLKDLESVGTNITKVRTNVTARIDEREAAPFQMPSGVSPESTDNLILAIANAIKVECGESLAIVTADRGMRVKCAAQSIDVISLPADLKLELPGDRDKQKIKQLEQQLARQLSRQPELVVTVSAGQDSSDRVRLVCPPSPSLIDLTAVPTLADITSAFHHIGERKIDQDPLLQSLRGGNIPSRSECDRFNKELPSYHSAYAKHLQSVTKTNELRSRSILFALWLSNTGSAMARTVHVTIDCGSLLQALCATGVKGDWTSEPTAPEPPRAPRTREAIRREQMAIYPHVPFFDAEQFYESNPGDAEDVCIAKSTTGFQIIAKYSSLPHHDEVLIGNFTGLLPVSPIWTAIELKYSLRCEENIEVTSGVVVLSRRSPSKM